MVNGWERVKSEAGSYLKSSGFKIFFSGFLPVSFGLTGLLLMAGCAPKPKLAPEERTPQNVLRCALRNQIKFKSCASLVKLKLKGDKSKFSGTFEFFYKRPHTFTLYPRTFFGVGTFKVKGEKDSLIIYFPKQNEFYLGSTSDFAKTKLWGSEIPPNLLLEMIWGKAGLEEEGVTYAGRSEELFWYQSKDKDWLKEYWIDPKRCRLVKSRWRQNEGEKSYQIEYANFVTQNHVEIPCQISIKSQAGDFARIKLLERRFNLPIPDDKFELKIPPGARRVILETQKED